MASKLIPEKIKKDIINTIIIPSYYNDIKSSLQTRNFWSKVSTVCMTLNTILGGVSAILSFLATSSNTKETTDKYSILAGLCSIIAISLKEFGSFAKLQDHISTIESNEILLDIGIEAKIPDDYKEEHL